MRGFSSGAALATDRLRGRFLALTLLGSVGFVVLAALLERRATPHRAQDYTLAGAVFGWAIPLVAYAAVVRATRDARLDDAVRELARHGANRRAAALGLVVATGVSVALLGAILAVVGVLVAHGGVDGSSFRDALTSAWIAALGGGAYVAWLSLGSLAGRAGGGRAVFLGLDWVLGATTAATLIAVPWPRAHLRYLLGGHPVFGLMPWQSTLALYGLLGTYLVLAAARIQR